MMEEKNKMKKIVLAIVILVLSCRCSRANRAAISAWGKPHHIKLYSCGQVVGEWETTGKVENEAHSDGYYFQDDKSKRFITISGTVVIEVEP
jgi:hypothetical protein